MLAGEAVVVIWNDIVPDARADFYAWHLDEHMAERVGIPGFRRGRRFAATCPMTQPEFFTLYEVETMQVLQGQDYTNRLNAPTPWTLRIAQNLRNTSRGLARVVESRGAGSGGVMLTLSFDAPQAAMPAIVAQVREAGRTPRVCGAHLCMADAAASGVVTEEAKAKTGFAAPPDWIILVEAMDAAALAAVLPDAVLAAAGAGPIRRGLYGLELQRNRTAWSV